MPKTFIICALLFYACAIIGLICVVVCALLRPKVSWSDFSTWCAINMEYIRVDEHEHSHGKFDVKVTHTVTGESVHIRGMARMPGRMAALRALMRKVVKDD